MKSVSFDLPTAADHELAQQVSDLDRSLGARVYELEKRLATMEGRPAPPAPPPILPPRTGRRAAGAGLDRQRKVLKALGETYFKVLLAPGICLYEGGVVTEVLNNDAWVMRFPDPATGTADRVVETRELWVNTRPRVDVWYTSPVGSTATFDFRLAVWVFGPTGTTTYTPLLVTWTAPGPAVANDILKTSAVITSSRFPSSPFGVTRFRLGRLTGDANANARDVLAAVVTLEELA